MTLTEGVARRIQELLKNKKITQYRLTKETCLDRTTIQTIMHTKTKDIRLSTVYLIASAFDMTMAEFLDTPYFKEIDI